jgi:GNAT superfamily N-acetyltransferase
MKRGAVPCYLHVAGNCPEFFVKEAKEMILQIKDQEFTLRVAREDDLQKVLTLLVEAADWLQTKGTTQWDYYLTDLEGNKEEVLESIKKQNTYLLVDDGQAVATLTLEDEPSEWDSDIWGEEASQENVIYLHRLVVNRKYSGGGIGDALIDWAKEDVRNRGKNYIRFDCLNNNVGLNNYYQRHYRLKEIANIYGKHSKYEITL